MEEKDLREWMAEVYKEFQATRDHFDKKIGEVKNEVAQNREEFIIFKTKVSTRTALISASIGIAISVAALLIDLGVLRERAVDRRIENIENTE